MICDEMQESNGMKMNIQNILRTRFSFELTELGSEPGVFRLKQSLNRTNNKWFYQINSRNFSELLKQKE